MAPLMLQAYTPRRGRRNAAGAGFTAAVGVPIVRRLSPAGLA